MSLIWCAPPTLPSQEFRTREFNDPPVPVHPEPEPDEREPDDETQELVRPLKT